jgi:hypothetical protein
MRNRFQEVAVHDYFMAHARKVGSIIPRRERRGRGRPAEISAGRDVHLWAAEKYAGIPASVWAIPQASSRAGRFSILRSLGINLGGSTAQTEAVFSSAVMVKCAAIRWA